MRAEGKAARTVTLHLQALDFFQRWLGRPGTVNDLNRDTIRAWLGSLIDRGQAPGTVRTRFRGLHRVCTWAVGEELLDADPMARMEQPRPTETPVPVLTDDQLAAVVAACSGRGFLERRDEAVIRVLLDTGCRVSELIGLRVDDLDLDREAALVRGKGDKVRPLWFSPRTVRALDRYLRVRRTRRWSNAEALFLSQRGPLTTDGVRNLITARGRRAGVEGLHPHMFRHTWAHDFLVSGGQERDLKRLAGWSSDAMLSRYGASAADERARLAAQRFQRGDRV